MSIDTGIHFRADGISFTLDDEQVEDIVRRALQDDYDMLVERQRKGELFDPDKDPALILALREVVDYYGGEVT